jgi:phage tail protein X
VGDVGLVNHYGAEMAVEDVCVELAGFAGAHGLQEVGNVVAAAVALELPDLLAVVVEGPATPPVDVRACRQGLPPD